MFQLILFSFYLIVLHVLRSYIFTSVSENHRKSLIICFRNSVYVLTYSSYSYYFYYFQYPYHLFFYLLTIFLIMYDGHTSGYLIKNLFWVEYKTKGGAQICSLYTTMKLASFPYHPSSAQRAGLYHLSYGVRTIFRDITQSNHLPYITAQVG